MNNLVNLFTRVGVWGLLHPTENLEDLDATIQNIADSNGGFQEIDHNLIAVGFWTL